MKNIFFLILSVVQLGYTQPSAYEEYYSDPAHLQCAQVTINNDCIIEAPCFEAFRFELPSVQYAAYQVPRPVTYSGGSPKYLIHPDTSRPPLKVAINPKKAVEKLSPVTKEQVQKIKTLQPFSFAIRQAEAMPVLTVDTRHAPLILIWFNGIIDEYSFFLGERNELFSSTGKMHSLVSGVSALQIQEVILFQIHQ